ncbi:hypothetical protein KIN20_002375 [Parelaphostrongylus tenuis]|uniref:Uncharacterized protein n=1 Tax=Parelaphostrongylus tenuis TaxID=148309 RepID=A0AAD5MNH4_PARTN|nr:hypothetical protein KIN20_002375 [Parelaphostrongylus tenuis]
MSALISAQMTSPSDELAAIYRGKVKSRELDEGPASEAARKPLLSKTDGLPE